MRILVVSNLYPPVVRGGYEVECRDVVQHLRNRHEVVVLTSAHDEADSGTTSDVLRLLPFTDATRAGVLRAPIAALRGVRIMRRTLAQVRPDLVYVWNGAGLPYSALHELHRSGIPVAYRICEHWFGGVYHADLFMRYLLPAQRGHHTVWAAVVRAINRLPSLRLGEHPPADVAVCWNSDYLRSAVPVPKAVRPVLEHVVHPINAAADAMASITRRPTADFPVVLYVGRVSPEKGVDVVIKAVAELGRRYGHRVMLRVVGGGPPAIADELRTLATEQGVADQVIFTGPLRGAELHDAIATASVWVVPSVWEEPAPMVAVEAGLSRVPLVASRVGGIAELMREPDEALYFDRRDVGGCAAAMAEVLDGGTAVERRIELARRRADELRFGPYLDKMDDFLQETAHVFATRCVRR